MSAALAELDIIEPHRRAASVVDDIIIDRRQPVRGARLTMRELHAVLGFEVNFVALVAENMARGLPLGDTDRQRLLESRRVVLVILEDQLR